MNQYTHKNWDLIPWDNLSRGKRRQRLFKEANYSCTHCGFNRRRPDGGLVLEIDHINGDHNDNSKHNLQVLCPNCHAMTPNFRNWGRSNKKTSTRFRRENKDFVGSATHQDKLQLSNIKLELARQLHEQTKAYEENFISVVLTTFNSGEIDYAKFGWVRRLTEKLGQKNSQTVGRQCRRLLPDFYVNCFQKKF